MHKIGRNNGVEERKTEDGRELSKGGWANILQGLLLTSV
jgi:hypothetical protein